MAREPCDRHAGRVDEGVRVRRKPAQDRENLAFSWPSMDLAGMTILDLLCLPGASGSREFWQSACNELATHSRVNSRVLGWPGLGGAAARPDVTGFDDLVRLVVDDCPEPTHIAAQSMGGVVALRAALERPECVRSLTLCATAGGVDMAAMGAADWREGASEWHDRRDPRWFLDDRTDLSERLSEIRVPTLLLWGDADPLSPVAVGEHLEERIPDAHLVVIDGGDHDFVKLHAERVAREIAAHLKRVAQCESP